MVRQLRRLGTILLGALLVTGFAVTPAFADTGGGCWDGHNSRVCISVQSGTTNPLLSDYYLNSTSLGEYTADTYFLYNYSPGSCTSVNGYSSIFKGTRSPVPLGHSPIYSTYKPAGANCGRTHVIFYSSSGQWIYDNYSPWERW